MQILNKIYKILQHPLAKLVIAPLSAIIFGLITGISEAEGVRWLELVLLIVIVISSQLLEHYFYLYFTAQNNQTAPRIILYILEGLLLGASIWFILKHNWYLNSLLLLYVLILHIQYVPYKLSYTPYQYLLNSLANGFLLNVLAYSSQTGYITTDYLFDLVPLVIVSFAIQLQVNHMRLIMTENTTTTKSTSLNASLILMLIASVWAFITCLPSKSYYLVQVLFVVISIAVSLPFRVRVKTPSQCQNKLNHATVTHAVFAIFYALAYIF